MLTRSHPKPQNEDENIDKEPHALAAKGYVDRFENRFGFGPRDPPRCALKAMDVRLEDAIKKPSRNAERRTLARTASCWAFGKDSADEPRDGADRPCDGDERNEKVQKSQEESSKIIELRRQLDEAQKELKNALKAAKDIGPGDVYSIIELTKQKMPTNAERVSPAFLNVLKEVRHDANLFPMQQQSGDPSTWERIAAVVDSGATVTALHPKHGKGYEIQESPASLRGVEYETAGGGTLANLGEKLMAVLTAEGTLRGFRTQMAEVTSPLESVRQLLGSKHCVLFGLGPNEEDHLIINKITGEINVMRDDGVNYIHDLIVVPPGEVERVQQTIASGGSPFGGLA